MQETMPDNERLIDLVRYCRAYLHDEGLITDDEYAALVQVGSDSARRLESYDALRQRVDLLRDTLGLTSSLLRVVMDATYQSDDGWNPHPDVDNRTWSPDAHVGLTFTVQELRQMKGALARARALLSDAAPTE